MVAQRCQYTEFFILNATELYPVYCTVVNMLCEFFFDF